MGANHCLADEFFVGRIDSLIECHVDVGANFPLGLHGDLGVHADFVAVDVGFEGDAVMVDFGISKGKHLKTARIGKGWTMPASEFGETAGFFDKVWTGSEDEVISVSKDALRTKLAHLGVSDSFDGSARGGTNESGCFYVAVWSVNNAGAHQAFLFDDVEL